MSTYFCSLLTTVTSYRLYHHCTTSHGVYFSDHMPDLQTCRCCAYPHLVHCTTPAATARYIYSLSSTSLQSCLTMQNQCANLECCVQWKPVKIHDCSPQACSVLSPLMASVRIIPVKPSMASLQQVKCSVGASVAEQSWVSNSRATWQLCRDTHTGLLHAKRIQFKPCNTI
jgi:hypothetical protein